MTEGDLEILESMAEGWAMNGMCLPGNFSVDEVREFLMRLGATKAVAAIDEQLSYYDQPHYKSDWKVNVHDVP